ncbi:hypothetical protein [Flagellimonas sp. S3867]|uniref:hypothetical protein n=1 Tax=Flagellimonas sp. S3867 TaxID=2768063 RepID=UPI001687CA80|nr:hypothetical protein [Flagellimonas sp. S3867]
MGRFIIKFCLYLFLAFLFLEATVRIFHLHNDSPDWYLDENKMYKRVPNQEGHAVFGNRRQQFSPFRINAAGYNSYREFEPTEDGVEVAILGDSFIEGLHQDYRNSIGRKVERGLSNVHIYEYGHSDFDLADQMYLVHTNKEEFEKVDFIIYELKYYNDLLRSEYSVKPRKVVFPLLRHSKLLVYLLDIGMIDPVKRILRKLSIGQKPRKDIEDNLTKDLIFMDNFIKLNSKYGLEKDKTAILLDTRQTNKAFLDYLEKHGIHTIDYGRGFEKSTNKPTTLIYDQHWNDHGRNLVANEIISFFKKNQLLE